ncbi:hypothetical protein [Kitasatospora sp. NPDC005856]|uniref:hypothetical protein n=1 Tax=Kitasatospora sp. NPDC005856 TaxID=3154566 RepID=UPI0033CFCB2E
MATSSRAEALSWYRGLQPMGVEGICAKGWNTRYRPTARAGAGAWQKIRHVETVDAQVLAVTGTPLRPQSLVLRLPDGAAVVTSPRLAPVQAQQVADALTGHLAPEADGTGTTWTVTGPVRLAEVVIGTGRHGTVRFVRLRPEE